MSEGECGSWWRGIQHTLRSALLPWPGLPKVLHSQKLVADRGNLTEPSATDANGLTVQEVGAIHLYSQDGPFYHRLNTLLNAKQNRGKRLQVNSRVHLQKKKNDD